MGWRNPFRTPPPPPPPPAPAPSAPILRAPVPVVRPAAYQAVPATTGNPDDAAVVSLWLAYQSHVPSPSWGSFVANIRKENAALEKRVRDTEKALADYRSLEVFRP